MKISDILSSKKTTVSLEVFPPKQWNKLEESKQTVEKLLTYKPDFVSVTYGAAGTTSGYTAEIAEDILAHGGVPLSHLTCINSEKSKVREVIDTLEQGGIKNILALRGDIPKEMTERPHNAFHYANELIAYLKAKGDYCVGAACYPEKHPESESIEADIQSLVYKADAGADFFTTQMFFDNTLLFRFKERCQKAGIAVPVIAGIMPITAVGQIGRSVSLSGCTIPKAFAELAATYAHSPADMRKAGTDYAIAQIRDLLEHGQNNIHIYTMNKPEITAEVLKGIADLIR